MNQQRNFRQNEKDKFENLLIFGYSCKIFHDDERAMLIEEGKHLIPWMGDTNHKIDRFDCRGAISNLKIYEAPENVGFYRGQFLSQEELRMEEIYDQERYRSLHEDDYDYEAREEEAVKRRKHTHDYNYDYNNPPPTTSQTESEDLSVKTLASCIEKTAEFIVKQGLQMEIYLRTKESNNPKFQFLNPENPYHPIYQQVLEKKKKRPKNYVPNSNLIQESSLEVEKSLKKIIANLPNSAPALKKDTKSSTTSTSTCAYSLLVEKIKESQAITPTSSPPVSGNSSPTPPTVPPPPPPIEDTEEQEEKLDDGSVWVYPPPIHLQPLIDKTASVMARKGTDMIPLLKKYEGEKFHFLREDDKYHTFFKYKMEIYKEMNRNPKFSYNGASTTTSEKTGKGSSTKKSTTSNISSTITSSQANTSSSSSSTKTSSVSSAPFIGPQMISSKSQTEVDEKETKPSQPTVKKTISLIPDYDFTDSSEEESDDEDKNTTNNKTEEKIQPKPSTSSENSTKPSKFPVLKGFFR